MPKKKIIKKTPAKRTPKRKKLRDANKHEMHFMGLVLMFAGFSFYAVASFFNSTNNFIDYQYASVVEAEGAGEIAAECYTCPEPAENFPECDLLWETNVCPLSNGFVADVFSDVPASYHGYKAIVELYDRGVVSGYDDGSFKPDKVVNRAEFVKIAMEAAQVDLTTFDGEACEFSDVVHGDWYEVYVCVAKDKGWVNGYDGNLFRSDQSISRVEALKIVMSVLDYDLDKDCEPGNVEFNKALTTFNVDADAWYAGHVCTVFEDESVSLPIGDLDPGHAMTRGEVVQMVHQVMDHQGLL